MRKAAPASVELAEGANQIQRDNYSTADAVFPLYGNHTDISPARLISLDDLAYSLANGGPRIGPKKNAPLITPFKASGKTRDHASKADFFALAIDHDDDNKSAEGIRALYDPFGVAFFAFTSASHEQEKGGVVAKRWKVLIPLAEPVCADDYNELAQGAALHLQSDKAQARATQGFYAPNKLTEDAPFDFIDATARPLLDPNETTSPLVVACLTAYSNAQEAQERAQAAALAKAKAAKPKPRRGATGEQAGIIAKVCDQFDLTGELQARGYQQVRKAFLSPQSTTGMAGVIILRGDDGKARCYSHHGESDPLSNLNHDGHALDVFDVLCCLDYGGDVSRAVLALAPKVDPDGQKRRQREHMAEKSRQQVVKQFGAAVTADAQKLADSIHGQLLAMLAVDAKEQPEEAASLKPNAENITRMINGAFWSGGKSKLFLLNHDESLVQFLATDAFKFLTKTFAAAVNQLAVATLAANLDFGLDPAKAAPARAKFVANCMAVAKTAILDHLKYHNQRESIEWRVDMFGRLSRLELLEDKARIVLTHKPFPVFDQPEGYARIIADYKEHFTRFDDFLNFVTMARFALDRKKAYLWVLADSDWGKGFLTGVLAKLGVCVETSMKEVEAMLEGKPVGRSAEDFKRAFVLLIDEFKTVKSELKQLQSQITLSPKNQLSCTVEIFAKVFTSAESVGSLVTENGVEDQFANRMSIFQEAGDITKRPVFQEVGNSRYFRAVLAYTAGSLNNGIGAMQRLGKEEAEAHAEACLNGFIKLHGLDTVYERFSDSLPALAAELVEYFTDGDGSMSSLVINDHGAVYLRSPAKAVDDYLVEHYDQSQITAFRKKKDELIRLMCVEGKGNKTHRIKGEPKRAVKMKD